MYSEHKVLQQVGESTLRPVDVARTQSLIQCSERIFRISSLAGLTCLLRAFALRDALQILLERRECLLRAGQIAGTERLRECIEVLPEFSGRTDFVCLRGL